MASGVGSVGDPRVYDMSLETNSGVVNTPALIDEISNDGTLSALVASNVATDKVGDSLSIGFTTTLTSPEITALDAVVLAHAGTVTTRDYQMWESAATQSTTLETWQNVMNRTAPALVAGTYRVMWHWEMRVAPAGPVNSKASARFNYNNSTPEGIHHTIETDWQTVDGWDRVASIPEGSTPSFDIDIQRDPTLGGNDTVEIRRMKLSFERMS